MNFHNQDWQDRPTLLKRLAMNDIERVYATERDDRGRDLYALTVLAGIGALFIALVAVKCAAPRPAEARSIYQKPCTDCHNYKSQMAAYLSKRGSKTPQELADALLKTKSPRLLAAVAVVESNGNKSAVNTKHGYRNRSLGTYQVRPRHWGTVPADAYGQTMQAEAILDELTETQGIIQALNQYGGERDVRHGKYAYSVLREMQEVPR